MNRKDYEDVALAFSMTVARCRGELDPGGKLHAALGSMKPGGWRLLFAFLADTMADQFTDMNIYRFNREAFLDACGLLEDVKALGLAAPSGRRVGSPIDYDQVRKGDCLYFVTAGGGQYGGVVAKITNLAVTLGHVWDLVNNFEIHGGTRLRRANWSRHHVELMDQNDLPPFTEDHHADSERLEAPEGEEGLDGASERVDTAAVDTSEVLDSGSANDTEE